MTKQTNISRITDSAVSTLTQTAPSEIRERPILFSGAMVKAILDGRKTQTRRVIKPQPVSEGIRSYGEAWAWNVGKEPWFSGVTEPQMRSANYGLFKYCPYGQTGDRLWVRETWMPDGADVRFEMMRRGEIPWAVRYAASEPELGKMFKWHPSIFMPRPACRIILELTSVRVERIQDCSEEDAIAEGGAQKELLHPPDGFDPDSASPPGAFGYVSGLHPFPKGKIYPRAAEAFAERWDSINAKRGYGWSDNPWVWVIEFKRISVATV